jgi:Tol biopolymer transport system component
LYAAVIEEQGAMRRRLLLINMRSGETTVLTDGEVALKDPIPRPRRASVLYRRGDDEVWLVNYDAKQNYRLRLAPGHIEQTMWSPDGRSVLYLNVPSEEGKLNGIREFVPDTNEDRPVADTTQYRTFGVNGDASMFVGISGSLASPYVFLLSRKANRELALCEHGGRGGQVVFSPDSQRVFFDGTLHGKLAIYMIDVAKMVEQTEGGN